MKVYYDTEVKKYFLIDDNHRRYLASVSDLIRAHTFILTADARKKAAEKHAKKRKVPVETILEEWDLQYNSAVDHGNAVHEAESREFTGTLMSTGKENGVVEYEYRRVRDLPDGEYHELRLFCDKYFLSARIDYCRIYTSADGQRYVHIRDYKTGWIRDFRQSETTGAVYHMKPPLQRIPDSEVGKVTVQLSIYGYLFSIEGITPELELWHEAITRDSESLECIGPYMSEASRMYMRYIVPFIPQPVFFLLNKNKIRSYATKNEIPQRNPFAKSRS
jgi:hypothetical protein